MGPLPRCWIEWKRPKALTRLYVFFFFFFFFFFIIIIEVGSRRVHLGGVLHEYSRAA